MKVDPVDVLVNGCGWSVASIFLVMAATVIGALTGAVAVACGLFTDVGVPAFWIHVADLKKELLLALAANLFLGALATPFFLRSDHAGATAWGVLTGICSLVIVVAAWGELDGWGRFATSGAWLALLGMMGTGLWFFRQWQTNRWAVDMAMIQARNEAKRAELRARGVAVLDRDEPE